VISNLSVVVISAPRDVRTARLRGQKLIDVVCLLI